MKFNRVGVYNIDNAIFGMRNPLESNLKSDSYFDTRTGEFIIGEKDKELAQRLILSGSEHGKFLRQVFVSVDISAALFYWKEMDQYKIGTTTNSTSTMHTLTKHRITRDCFDTSMFEDRLVLIDDMHVGVRFDCLLDDLEQLRQLYLQTKDRRYWDALITMLPESWIQTRTWTSNYAQLRNIIKQRKNHKLPQWHEFIEWCHTLPYADELLFVEKR